MTPRPRNTVVIRPGVHFHVPWLGNEAWVTLGVKELGVALGTERVGDASMVGLGALRLVVSLTQAAGTKGLCKAS